MRVEEGFQPTPPSEGNTYTTDPVLPSLLKRLLPKDALPEIHQDLERFGGEILTSVRSLSTTTAEPTLIQYNHWGQRVDDLQTPDAWKNQKAKMQEEGAVGIFYERKFQEFSRVYGFAKIFLSIGDTDVIWCPLSMTDGCARVLELIGTPALKRDIYPRLVHRDPELAYTAGQWMTERPGGSDVSQTETVATKIPNATSPYGEVYSINGFKWFSSATDSDVALALARTGPASAGSRGLSLFLLPVRRPILRGRGEPRPPALTNNIKIHRLKNKVGTKVLPTAELSIEGAEGYLLGPINQGVKLITPVLNLTRVHSATSSVGSIRRCLAVATAYSTVRAIGGGRQLLQDNALHVSELARANLTYRALTHMLFHIILLLGKTECGTASEAEELRLRVLTPAIKAFAADKSCAVMEECMAMLGGQGYMEESRFGTNIKDALVEKIWEGTISVLALDVVRAMSKPGVLQAFLSWANDIISSCPDGLAHELSSTLSALRSAVEEVNKIYTQVPVAPLVPRPALFVFSYVASALCLLEHAIWAWKTGEPTAEVDAEVVRRWVEEAGLKQAVDEVHRARDAGENRTELDKKMVYGGFATKTTAREDRVRASL